MRVAGIEIPASAVAELAVRLDRAGHSDLAQYIGRAVDNNRPAVSFGLRDLPIVLGVLEDCPAGLAPLRAVLLHQHVRRQREGFT
jgi:hypothetical protein